MQAQVKCSNADYFCLSKAFQFLKTNRDISEHFIKIIGNSVGANPIGAYLVLCSNSRFQALPTNIRPPWRCLIFTNALAYNKTLIHVNE
jgi:hypothetical protein